MSFSVTFIGKPDAIKRKLAETSDNLSGPSKSEFDAVRPALETILDQQVGHGVVRLDANDHANFTQEPGEPGKAYPGPARFTKTFGTCNVEVKTLGQIAE